MRGIRPSRLTGRRRLVSTVTLGVLAVSQAVVGGWALAAPGWFFAAFPAAMLPPDRDTYPQSVSGLARAPPTSLSPSGYRPTSRTPKGSQAYCATTPASR